MRDLRDAMTAIEAAVFTMDEGDPAPKFKTTDPAQLDDPRPNARHDDRSEWRLYSQVDSQSARLIAPALAAKRQTNNYTGKK